MKRTFAVVGLSYLAAQAAAVLCGLAVGISLFCIATLGALLVFALYKNRPKELLWILISCAVSFGAFSAATLLSISPSAVLEGQEIHITGTVDEAPMEANGRHYYYVETDSVGMADAPQSVKLRLSSKYSLEAEYGDKLSGFVRFNYQSEESVSRRVLLADGISATAYLPIGSEMAVKDGGFSLYGSVIRLREGFSASAVELLGGELGGLLRGMTTGDCTLVGERIASGFRDCGLSHLLAVSGIHLSLLAYAVTRLLRRFGLGYRAVAAVTIPFILFFMAFAGFSMSIRRAGIVAILALVATAIKREADPLNSLGAAALAICLFNPFAAADVGLLMSVLCSLGLILLFQPVGQKLSALIPEGCGKTLKTVLLRLVTALNAAVLCAVFSFPVTALAFGETSAISPLSNLVCLVPFSAFMIFGSIAAVLYMIPIVGGALGFVFMLPAWISGRFGLLAVKAFSGLPGAGVSVNYPFLPVFFIAAGVIVLYWYLRFGRSAEKTVSLLLCACLITQIFMLGAAAYKITFAASRSITVFNTDGGVFSTVESGGRCVIIGCGGDGYNGWLTAGKLSKDNITDAQAVFIPSLDGVFSSQAVETIERFEPEAVFLPDAGVGTEAIVKAAREYDARLYDVDDASFSLSGCGVSVDVYTDRDDRRWIWAENGGLTMLVCPDGGDCSLLPESMRRPDVMLLTGSDIANLGEAEPTATIISADERECAAARAVLSYRGVKNIYTTAGDGDLTVTAQKSGVILTARKGE